MVSLIDEAGGIEDAGEVIFQSPMNSQEEVNRFSLVNHSSNVDVMSDPSEENRNVVSIYTPQDAFRGADVAYPC